MNTVWQTVVAHPWTEIAGWSLVHFLWQGLLIGLCVAALLASTRHRAASVRYLMACAGLALMALAPVVTVTCLVQNEDKVARFEAVPELHSPVIAKPDALVASPSQLSDNKEGSTSHGSPPNSQQAMPASEAGSRDWFQPFQRALPFIVCIWSAGVVCLSLRLLAGLICIARWRKTAAPVAAGALKQAASRLAARMGLKQGFELLESVKAQVPAVVGWLRPVVMVPASLVSGLNPAELESLLAHELAHIRRHDYLVNLVQIVIETVLFYHPAVWWLSAVIRVERENCCDDLAVAACGDRVVFARALARMEELRCRQPGLALSARGGPLLHRIRRLLLPNAAPPVVGWSAGLFPAASLAILAAGLWVNMDGDKREPGMLAENGFSRDQTELKAGLEPAPPTPDDDQFVTHRQETKVVDSVTGQSHQVLAGARLTSANDSTAAVDLKYSNLMLYTFIPARIAKELGAIDLGEIDFGNAAPLKAEPQQFAIPLSSLVPPPPGAQPAAETPAQEQRSPKEEFVLVDDLDGPAGERKIVPYPDSAIFVPEHLAFYGVNQTGQRKFRVVRIEKVSLGIGPSFGPVNALVLDDANSSIGVLGSNWARNPRGPKGESFVHSAVDGFWFMALVQEPAREKDIVDQVRVFRMSHIQAEQAEHLVREHFDVPDSIPVHQPDDPLSSLPLRVSHDSASNSVIVIASDATLRDVAAFLANADAPVAAASQTAVEERVLASHSYDMARRESTDWVEINGTQVPVDAGVEHAGIRIYVSLMMDVVAVDAKSGKALWSLPWGKTQPVWQKVSIVEITVDGEKTLVVELVAADGIRQRFDFRSGKPLEGPAAREVVPAPTIVAVQRDGDRITTAMLENPGSDRSAVNLIQRFRQVFERQSHPMPGHWVTDEESLVSSDQVRYVIEGPGLTGMDADEVVFSLPEGSGMRAEFTGNNVALESTGEITTVTIRGGRLRLIDAGGVCRADASADGGADLLIVECRRAGEEYSLRMKSGWSKPESGSGVTPVQVKLFLATGAPADEEQPPHRAVRYRIEQDATTPGAPARMKMSWHYDLSRLAAEAEQESGKTIEELVFGVPNNDGAPAQTFQTAPGTGSEPQREGGLMPPAQIPENSDPAREAPQPIVEKEPEWGALAEFSGLQSRLVLQTAMPTVGQPLLFSLELRNAGDKPARYDPQDYAPFRVLRAARADGKPSPFIGLTPQTSAQPVTLQPGEATVLWKDVDAAELFVLMDGKHEFMAEGGEWAAQTLWRDSNRVAVELQPGQLSPLQALIRSLNEMEVRPADWTVSAGFGAIYLSHSPTNLKSDVTTIQLWFTEEPLPADYQLGEGAGRQEVITIAPCELGYLHVAAPPRARELWPEYVRDIRIAAARALNFNARPEPPAPATDDGADRASALLSPELPTRGREQE